MYVFDRWSYIFKNAHQDMKRKLLVLLKANLQRSKNHRLLEVWTILIFHFDYLIKSCMCITGKHNKFFNSVSVVCMKFVNVV